MTASERGDLGLWIAWVEGAELRLEPLALPAGIRLGEALARAVTLGVLPAAVAADAGVRVAVHGRLRAPEHELHDGDRIELLGPLLIDPKEARARRAASRRAAARRS